MYLTFFHHNICSLSYCGIESFYLYIFLYVVKKKAPFPTVPFSIFCNSALTYSQFLTLKDTPERLLLTFTLLVLLMFVNTVILVSLNSFRYSVLSLCLKIFSVSILFLHLFQKSFFDFSCYTMFLLFLQSARIFFIVQAFFEFFSFIFFYQWYLKI